MSISAIFADLKFPLFPPAASVQAHEVDALYYFFCIVSVVMSIAIFSVIFYFASKYRRRSEADRPTQIEGSTALELTWTILPFLVMLVMFAWGAQLYYAQATPPRDAQEIFVTGKQWMWKIQYPDGQREINELNVPVGQPVKLTMASEDVIHSFYVPAFRVKHDVMPGHYNNLWFTPSKPGRYHLFCTEYCGNQHAGMGGYVNVLDQKEYAKWSSGGSAMGSLSSRGEQLFQQGGCATCHLQDQQGRGPVLRGLYGKQVSLVGGKTVIADDAYIRESILNANAKIAFGFQPNIMPTYAGQLSEESVISLVAYVKSLGGSQPPSQYGTQQMPIVIAPTDPGAAGTLTKGK